MSLDIYSYFEVRRSTDEPWRLWREARVDEEGRYDVPDELQPFGLTRDRRFATALTGVITRDEGLDHARLQPIVPEDREMATDLSSELARIADGYAPVWPQWITMADFDRIDWNARIPMTDPHAEETWEDVAYLAKNAQEQMRPLIGEHGADNVRLVFWFT